MTGSTTLRASALTEPTAPSDANEFHFAISGSIQDQLDEHLFPDDDHWSARMCERGVIGLITRSTGRRRTTYLLKDLVPPEEDDIYEAEDGIRFAPGYRERATKLARRVDGAGLIYIHSHPGRRATPSSNDLSSDRTELYEAGKHLGETVPLAAGIIAEEPSDNPNSREWSVRAYEFNIPTTSYEAKDPDYGESSAAYTHATAVRVAGHRLRKLRTIKDVSGPSGVGGEPDSIAQDSTVKLWGEEGQKTLAGMRVGVTGLGGVGSLLAEQLARLGFGETVFVDFDHIERDNLNRAYGATKQDAIENTAKVDVAQKIAERGATAPDFTVRTVYGSVVEDSEDQYAALPDLLDCDFIINAADTHWVRYVLDEVAYAHLIPVMDGGTTLRFDDDLGELASTANSTVSLSGPCHPCLECTGNWFMGDEEVGVVADRMDPDYRGGDERAYAEDDNLDDIPRAPSVISNNGLVASLLVLRAQALTLGTTSAGLVGSQEYNARNGTVSWQSLSGEQVTDCSSSCDRHEITAQGDSYELPTGRDLDLRKDGKRIQETLAGSESEREPVADEDHKTPREDLTFAKRIIQRTRKSFHRLLGK